MPISKVINGGERHLAFANNRLDNFLKFCKAQKLDNFRQTFMMEDGTLITCVKSGENISLLINEPADMCVKTLYRYDNSNYYGYYRLNSFNGEYKLGDYLYTKETLAYASDKTIFLNDYAPRYLGSRVSLFINPLGTKGSGSYADELLNKNIEAIISVNGGANSTKYSDIVFPTGCEAAYGGTNGGGILFTEFPAGIWSVDTEITDGNGQVTIQKKDKQVFGLMTVYYVTDRIKWHYILYFTYDGYYLEDKIERFAPFDIGYNSSVSFRFIDQITYTRLDNEDMVSFVAIPDYDGAAPYDNTSLSVFPNDGLELPVIVRKFSYGYSKKIFEPFLDVNKNNAYVKNVVMGTDDVPKFLPFLKYTLFEPKIVYIGDDGGEHRFIVIFTSKHIKDNKSLSGITYTDNEYKNYIYLTDKNFNVIRKITHPFESFSNTALITGNRGHNPHNLCYGNGSIAIPIITIDAGIHKHGFMYSDDFGSTWSTTYPLDGTLMTEGFAVVRAKQIDESNQEVSAIFCAVKYEGVDTATNLVKYSYYRSSNGFEKWIKTKGDVSKKVVNDTKYGSNIYLNYTGLTKTKSPYYIAFPNMVEYKETYFDPKDFIRDANDYKPLGA